MSKKQPDLPEFMVNRIARLIFNGFDDSEISVMTNLPVFRLKKLRAGTGDLRVKKSALLLKSAAIERVMKSRGKITGLCWFLERRYPRQYARPEIQLSMASGVTHNNTLVISADVAEGLLKRSKATLTELDKLIADKTQGFETSDTE